MCLSRRHLAAHTPCSRKISHVFRPPKQKLEEECKLELLDVASVCKAVICCRVSPIQKAEVVRLVKDNKKVCVEDTEHDTSGKKGVSVQFRTHCLFIKVSAHLRIEVGTVHADSAACSLSPSTTPFQRKEPGRFLRSQIAVGAPT